MTLDRDSIEELLGRVPYPGFRKDIVSMGVVRSLRVDGASVALELDLGPGHPSIAEPLERAVRDALADVPGLERLDVRFAGAPRSSPGLEMAGPPRPRSAARAGAADPALLPGVRHTVAVASGKGGVGKSTLAVNLAVALAQRGLRAGLLDADIYGPSIPTMLGTSERPRLDPDGRRLLPFQRHGIRYMSLGFLVDPDTAVIWRGPLVMKALEQLLRDVVWGDLDVLVIDLPPGTGDAQLTISQRLRLSGAVLVSTPQDVALADAYKGLGMFRKVGVPILGWVENMSGFACPHCGETTDVFGRDGVARAAATRDVPFLGAIPLDPSVRVSSDAGTPLVVDAPDSIAGRRFLELAASLMRTLEPGSDPDPSPADPEPAGSGAPSGKRRWFGKRRDRTPPPGDAGDP